MGQVRRRAIILAAVIAVLASSALAASGNLPVIAEAAPVPAPTALLPQPSPAAVRPIAWAPRPSMAAAPPIGSAQAHPAPNQPSQPHVAAKPLSMDLFRRGDFVAQTNLVQCVGASMQMMINMVEPGGDRTAATQRSLFRLAQRYSDLLSPRPGRKGASVRGWAAGLNDLGYGPYRVAGYDTLQGAMRAAASAIRATGRPVGLLMWRGRHAWVMSGFEASADPRRTADYVVRKAVVMDPLYPLGSRTWGPSPAPGAALSMSTLGRQFVPRTTRGPGRSATSTCWSCRFSTRRPGPAAAPPDRQRIRSRRRTRRRRRRSSRATPAGRADR